MTTFTKFAVRAVLVASVWAVGAAPALAQDTNRVELGASLANVLVMMPHGGGGNTTLVGVPTAGFGLVTPAVYASFFFTSRLALEPQAGLFLISDHGTDHYMTLFGHVDYFAGDPKKSSPFLFVGGGFIGISDEDTIKAVDGGAGYRFRVGDRLTFRLDARYTHYYENNGNSAALTLSIGGLLGK